jgi:hypothetical protein
VVNEYDQDSVNFALIHHYEDLTETNPLISLVNDSGDQLWSLSVENLRGLSKDESLKYVHRTLLVDNCCYVTSNEHIFEFDLLSGNLNWYISL